MGPTVDHRFIGLLLMLVLDDADQHSVCVEELFALSLTFQSLYFYKRMLEDMEQ